MSLKQFFAILKPLNEQSYLRRRILEAEKAELKLRIAQAGSRIRAIEKELRGI